MLHPRKSPIVPIAVPVCWSLVPHHAESLVLHSVFKWKSKWRGGGNKFLLTNKKCQLKYNREIQLKLFPPQRKKRLDRFFKPHKSSSPDASTTGIQEYFFIFLHLQPITFEFRVRMTYQPSMRNKALLQSFYAFYAYKMWFYFIKNTIPCFLAFLRLFCIFITRLS